MLRPNAGAQQKQPIRLRQIEIVFISCRPGQFFHLQGRKQLGKCIDDFLPYFKAAGPDSRPYGGQHVIRLRAVGLAHAPQRLRRDVSRRSPPAAVTYGDSMVHRIAEQQGRAIGEIHRQRHAGFIGHQAVARRNRALPLQGPPSPVGPSGLNDVDAVYLIAADDVLRHDVQSRQIAAAVFQDMPRIVAAGKAHVERRKGSAAHAALPRRYGGSHIRQHLKYIKGNIKNTVFFLQHRSSSLLTYK